MRTERRKPEKKAEAALKVEQSEANQTKEKGSRGKPDIKEAKAAVNTLRKQEKEGPKPGTPDAKAS